MGKNSLDVFKKKNTSPDTSPWLLFLTLTTFKKFFFLLNSTMLSGETLNGETFLEHMLSAANHNTLGPLTNHSTYAFRTDWGKGAVKK